MSIEDKESSLLELLGDLTDNVYQDILEMNTHRM